MDAFFTKLGSLILGEEEEETEQVRAARAQARSKLQMLAKSQRGVLLEDLEHAIQELHRFLDPKGSGDSAKRRSSMDVDAKADSVNAQAATMMESTDDRKQLLLHDELAVVNMLCMHLDRCVTHGLRPVENDELSTVKFFGVVKWTCTRVEALRQRQMVNAMHNAGSKKVAELVTSSVQADMPRHVRAFFAAVRAANGLANVHTDEGKARAFVRQALNMHVLKSCMSMILSESNLDLLASYYTEFALFRQRDDVKVFLNLLSGLDDLPFVFLIDDMRLDMAPDALPFSKPLPRPKPQKFKKRAPKLIDPEDMIGGRVRLCDEDNEANLLAEKLVSHHELRSAFNSMKGGNPLSEILEKAQQTRKLEDAATAVLRFLELGYPEYDVFGTELLDVLCNPFLSGMARFETAMGIPDVVEACFCHLYDHLDTPGLFQVHLQADHVMELRDTIEELGGFHKQMAVDPHEVAAVLFQYLWELPDSLLTAERLENFLACGDQPGVDGIMSVDERKMLLKVLVNDLPWYCKPILERLCHLVATALEPCHAEKSGLSVFSLANSLAPIILRKKHSYRFHEYEDSNYRKYPIGYQQANSVRMRLMPDDYDFDYDIDRKAMEARALRQAKREAEEGASVLALLFAEHEYILSDFRRELVRRREKLQEKVYMMETIRFKMDEAIDVNNEAHTKLLLRLWNGLLEPETEEHIDTTDIQAVLASSRWKISGFHTENPLGGFRGGGMLSLETLVYFVEEYPDKAHAMMRRNALPGGNRYPFPVASINVMRMMMKLLMLDEAPDICSKLVLHSTDDDTPTVVLKMRVAERVSRTPFWHVFDERDAFSKLHSMAFMLLDLHWINSGATQMGFQPVLDATRRQMGWLLEQAPKNVDEMWTKWMEVREQHVAKYTPIYQQQQPGVDPAADSNASDDLAQQITQNLEEKRAAKVQAEVDVSIERVAADNDGGSVVPPVLSSGAAAEAY